jgi:hypothetical protein
MKRIYASGDMALLQFLHDTLAGRGIRVMIRNQLLQGAAGELPPTECWPELWVMDDADADIARTLVEEAARPPANDGRRWICACGEVIEPQFSSCWSCGAEKGR